MLYIEKKIVVNDILMIDECTEQMHRAVYDIEQCIRRLPHQIAWTNMGFVVPVTILSRKDCNETKHFLKISQNTL